MKDMPERVRAAIEAGIESRVKRERAESELLQKRQRARALRERMAALEKALEPKEVEAWCADLTEDATGEVKTIEVNGEFGAEGSIRVVAPQEVAPSLAAGDVVAREVQAGAQAYFNAAILPGWQRHMPTYRAGRLSSVNKAADTATVVLDAARSSAQDLDVNAPGVLYDVPVRYMTCNATAFEANDHVIVEFQEQDWTQPVVIGFVANPQRCDVIVISRRGSRLERVYSEPLDEWVWVGVPYNTEWMMFDPRNGGVSLRGSRLIDRFAVNREPFFWRKKVWCARDEPHYLADSHDGETALLPGEMESVSIDGNEMVGLDYISGAWSQIKVYDAGTLELKRVLTRRIYPRRTKAKAGLVITCGGHDGWWIRLVDHLDDVSLAERLYGDDPVYDVAISRRYFAVLTMGWTNNIARIELFRRADLEPNELGNIPPLTPCDTITLPGNGNGYEALSMTDGHIVAVQNFSIFANSQVLVYRIADDAMTQTGSYYPWETSIDTGSVFAGN